MPRPLLGAAPATAILGAIGQLPPVLERGSAGSGLSSRLDGTLSSEPGPEAGDADSAGGGAAQLLGTIPPGGTGGRGLNR